MATIEKRKNKANETVYRVRIRAKGASLSETFYRLTDAKAWSRKQESNIDHGRFTALEADRRSFVELIERYTTEVLSTKKDWAKAQNRQLAEWLAVIGFARFRLAGGHLLVDVFKVLQWQHDFGLL